LYVSDYSTGIIHIFDLSGNELGHIPVSESGLAGLEFKCDSSTECRLYYANALTNQIGMVTVASDTLSTASKPLPRRTCGTTGNFTRPPFNVTHGAGYQNQMVVKYSYGKHCDGFKPGEDVEKTGNMTQHDVFMCPDRKDCSKVNGDAILMAGYYCHPCIPNPCQYLLRVCVDLFAFTCSPGFQCPDDPAQARARPFCQGGGAITSTTSEPTGVQNEIGEGTTCRLSANLVFMAVAAFAWL
jgi:hypothetical protein